jgi:FKBP-type peptidyl-prolyl cis-trans isomerase FkpA
VIFTALALQFSTAGCGRRSARNIEAPAAAAKPLADGLQVQDLVVGEGETAAVDRIVSIHYEGWLNGAKFDSSLARRPLEFRLGRGEVLRGWDLGIPGMKVGGKRKLTVPPELGYGRQGSRGGAIPPNSVLVFEISLVGAKDH